MTDVPDELDDIETLDFRPSGGIHLHAFGKRHRLRSPRMRDYRKLYELWSDEADALEEAGKPLTEFLRELMAVGDEREARGEPRITPEEKARDRQLGQESRQRTEDAALRWWAACIETLGVTENDRQVDTDDLPVSLTDPNSITLTLNHWRSVPSRSGVR